MKRNRRAVVVALLIVTAIGLAAATLTNPTTTGGGIGAGGGGGTGVGGGDGSVGNGSASAGGGGWGSIVGSFNMCVTFLTTDWFIASAVLVFLAIAVVLRWRTNTFIAGVVLAVYAPMILVIYSILTKCGSTLTGSSRNTTAGNVSNRTLPFDVGNAGGATETVTSPPVALFVAIVVVAALVLLFVRGSGDDTEAEEDFDIDQDDALSGMATAAGTAAERIESDADVENAVYRAWRDMTTHLDIDSPETTTPAEFAAAARETGMQREHVETLTDIFREVRYGGEPVTSEREERAVEALRDIESTYGTGDDG